MALSNNVVQVGNSFFLTRWSKIGPKLKVFGAVADKQDLTLDRRGKEMTSRTKQLSRWKRWGKEMNDYQYKNRWLLKSSFAFQGFFYCFLNFGSLQTTYREHWSRLPTTWHNKKRYSLSSRQRWKTCLKIKKISSMNIIHRKPWKSWNLSHS